MLVLPLLTVPYLTRVLGVDIWGRVAFAQIVLGYFSQVVAWGFGWSGTRKVAVLRDDPEALARILASTLLAQMLLAVLMALVVILLVLCVPMFRADAALYLAGLGMLAGNVLFPIWFLTGLERMKESAGAQIVARVVVVILTFVLVRGPEDAVWLMGLGALGVIAPGLFCLWWLHHHYSMDWRAATIRSALAELREGAAIFISTVSVSFYTTAIPLVLGVSGGPAAVAYFGLADRARQAAQSVLTPIAQALFPRMSHLFATDRVAAVRLLRRSGSLIIALALAISMTLWLAAPLIIRLLGGDAFLPAVPVLRWLAVLPMVIALSNIFGVQVLLPNHENRAFNIILGVAGLLSLALMPFLIGAKGAVGAAMNIVAAEMVVTVSMAIYLFRKGYFSGRLSRSESHAS